MALLLSPARCCSPRALYTKLLILGSTLTFLLFFYTISLSPSSSSYFSTSSFTSGFSSLKSSLSTSFPSWGSWTTGASPQYACSPSAYSSGQWTYSPKTNTTALLHSLDTLKFAGFQGCASNREYFWHLGVGQTRDNEDEGEQGIGKGMWDRFPIVSSWKWDTEGTECNMRPFNADDLVRSLVENGGWLLIGDSVTENHFFSLSCLLYPHVIAVPDYVKNPYFDRAWPQHLYLDPQSELVTGPRPKSSSNTSTSEARNQQSRDEQWTPLRFPPGFNISSTPLVTFRRVDLLLSQEELEDLYQAKHQKSPSRRQYPPQRRSKEVESRAPIPDPLRPLFSSEAVWTLSPSSYLTSLFLSPLPESNYATMIVSTAGHWTTGSQGTNYSSSSGGLFGAFDNTTFTVEGEDGGAVRDPGGIDALLQFFGESMEMWADRVQRDLNNDAGVVLGVSAKKAGSASKPKRAKRQILIRSYLPGHEDCHSYRQPWSVSEIPLPGDPEGKEAPQIWKWGWYNWPYISSLGGGKGGDGKSFNGIFETVLSDRKKYPNVHYLGIDRPARLRPDAHTTSDCLHIMSGAGVLEGWTEYIWHWVSSEKL